MLPQHSSQQQASITTGNNTSGQSSDTLRGTEPLQQSHVSPHAVSHDTPVGCQLSRGCPGEPRSYSADEEPGWFPEMEKVTAKACGNHAHDHTHLLLS